MKPGNLRLTLDDLGQHRQVLHSRFQIESLAYGVICQQAHRGRNRTVVSLKLKRQLVGGPGKQDFSIIESQIRNLPVAKPGKGDANSQNQECEQRRNVNMDRETLSEELARH